MDAIVGDRSYCSTWDLFSLFVLYRNKLQFSGWYKGKGRERLSKAATIILMCSSIFMLTLSAILQQGFALFLLSIKFNNW